MKTENTQDRVDEVEANMPNAESRDIIIASSSRCMVAIVGVFVAGIACGVALDALFLNFWTSGAANLANAHNEARMLRTGTALFMSIAAMIRAEFIVRGWPGTRVSRSNEEWVELFRNILRNISI